MLDLAIAPYPQLDVRAFITEFEAELGQVPSPAWLVELLGSSAKTPLLRDEVTRVAIRELLRKAGYKPTGRGKPASEYLVRAAEMAQLRSINLAVDCCNAVSLHSGVPVSVIDLARVEPPFRVDVGRAGDAYVFNLSGQVIDVSGLPCLFDRTGPCANPVKDAQRSKTSEATRSTLTLIWSAQALGGGTDAALAFYHGLLSRCGARVEPVTLVKAGGRV